ncbi:hypothetical protein V7I42_00175 [Raoultella ornithinolytica]|uniref:hypothetical protein n=1 Tax=Raoultella ornithinolytica TaxID=54291 RepID=UPI002FEEA2BE
MELIITLRVPSDEEILAKFAELQAESRGLPLEEALEYAMDGIYEWLSENIEPETHSIH